MTKTRKQCGQGKIRTKILDGMFRSKRKIQPFNDELDQLAPDTINRKPIAKKVSMDDIYLEFSSTKGGRNRRTRRRSHHRKK